MAATVNFGFKQLRTASKMWTAPASSNNAWSTPSASSNQSFADLARAQSLLTAYSAGPVAEVVGSKSAAGALRISG